MIKLDFEDAMIRQEDFDLLQDGHWINDNLIHFSFELLKKEFKHFHYLSPSMVQLLTYSQADGIAPKELKVANLVFIPINDNDEYESGGTHWSLMVYHRLTQIFFYYDSLKSRSQREKALLVKKRLEKVLNCSGTYFEEIETPMQVNGYDCGVYVMWIAEFCSRKQLLDDGITGKPGNLGSWRLSKSLKPEDITNYRRELRKTIIKMAAAYRFLLKITCESTRKSFC